MTSMTAHPTDRAGGLRPEPQASQPKALIPCARKPHFSFTHDALRPDCVTMNREPDDTYRRFNFDLCRALDMTKMSIVLGRMAEQGWLDVREVELFHMQAAALLAQLTTANNRAFAAQGTEAGTAATAQTDAVHDGPVAKPCAQDPSETRI